MNIDSVTKITSQKSTTGSLILLMLLIGCTEPLQPDVSIDPEEDAIKKVWDEKAGNIKETFSNLVLAGELIRKLPAWQTGNIPDFDSDWSAAQLSSALGRNLTAVETELLAELNALPYRVKTDPTYLGSPRSTITDHAPVFLVTGSFPGDIIQSAWLDKEATPELSHNATP